MAAEEAIRDENDGSGVAVEGISAIAFMGSDDEDEEAAYTTTTIRLYRLKPLTLIQGRRLS